MEKRNLTSYWVVDAPQPLRSYDMYRTNEYEKKIQRDAKCSDSTGRWNVGCSRSVVIKRSVHGC